MSGKLVILSGPSGVGKDTVIDEWRRTDPDVTRVVAYTTRSPRPGEQDHVDYHFVSRDDFLRQANDKRFLEFKEVHGNLYATPKHDMEEMLEQGKIAVLKIDVQGALAVMNLRPDATSVFLLPPSMAELERRIRDRGTEDPAQLQRRLDNALGEVDQAPKYRHQIVNDDIERVIEELVLLTRARR